MRLTTILLALFLAAPVLAEDIREGDTVFHPSWNDLRIRPDPVETLRITASGKVIFAKDLTLQNAIRTIEMLEESMDCKRPSHALITLGSAKQAIRVMLSECGFIRIYVEGGEDE